MKEIIVITHLKKIKSVQKYINDEKNNGIIMGMKNGLLQRDEMVQSAAKKLLSLAYLSFDLHGIRGTGGSLG